MFVLVTYLRELLPGAWVKSFRWDKPPLELVQVVLLVFGNIKICILIFQISFSGLPGRARGVGEVTRID